MKYFSCGNCKKSYKIDEKKVNEIVVSVMCQECKAQNVLRFGPVLLTQSNENVKQYALKMGENILGRKAHDSSVIEISDNYVSRNHASIFIEERDNKLFLFITDNNSSNGTFNHKKIRLKSGLKYPITPNDFFILGITKITVKFN
jgi:pSer/pThr/pTyr-binding forkhead associated (FHA) protein